MTEKSPKSHIKNSLQYIFATFAVILSNYFFHLIAARGLENTHYGVLSGLFAFFGFIAFAGVSLQTKMVEISARLIAQKKYETLKESQKSWLQRTIFASIGLTIIFIICSKLFADFFNTEIPQALSFAPVLVITLPLCIIRGFLQGLQKYKQLSHNFVLESILKLILASLAIISDLNLIGILLALTLSQIPSFIWGYLIIKKHQQQTDLLDEIESTEKTKKSIPSYILFWYFGLFAIWLNYDMMIIQHLLPNQSGNYSVASKLGQLIFFFTTNIGNFLLPILIEKIEQKQSLTKILIIGFSAIIIGGTFGIFFLEFTKVFFVDVLFGANYAEAKNWIKYFGIYGIIIGITHLLVQINIAKLQTNFCWPLTILTVLFMFSFYWVAQKDQSNIFNLIIFWSVMYTIPLIKTQIQNFYTKKFAS